MLDAPRPRQGRARRNSSRTSRRLTLPALVFGSDSTTTAAIDAYSAGVNAFIATQPLPAEFKLLAYRPEPWDSLAMSAWATVLAWGLACNWETELLRAWLLDEPPGRTVSSGSINRSTSS